MPGEHPYQISYQKYCLLPLPLDMPKHMIDVHLDDTLLLLRVMFMSHYCPPFPWPYAKDWWTPDTMLSMTGKLMLHFVPLTLAKCKHMIEVHLEETLPVAGVGGGGGALFMSHYCPLPLAICKHMIGVHLDDIAAAELLVHVTLFAHFELELISCIRDLSMYWFHIM